MLRRAFGLLALLFAVMMAPPGADAADVYRAQPAPRSDIVEVPVDLVPSSNVVPFPGPPSKFHVETRPPPAPYVRYGCKRIWRCDDQVCEWRRGCWGVYGYMEGPYYTIPLARSQWERHGWPSGR